MKFFLFKWNTINYKRYHILLINLNCPQQCFINIFHTCKRIMSAIIMDVWGRNKYVSNENSISRQIWREKLSRLKNNTTPWLKWLHNEYFLHHWSLRDILCLHSTSLMSSENDNILWTCSTEAMISEGSKTHLQKPYCQLIPFFMVTSKFGTPC